MTVASDIYWKQVAVIYELLKRRKKKKSNFPYFEHFSLVTGSFFGMWRKALLFGQVGGHREFDISK